MKHLGFALLLLIALALPCRAQSGEEVRIRTTLQQFIDGTTYNYPDTIAQAFYPNTRMFLHNDADTVWTVSAEEYASWYSRRPPGTRNARYSRIMAIDIVGTAAYARIEVDVPSFGNRYEDLLLLKKFDHGWKIVGKVTSASPIPTSPEHWAPKPSQTVIMEGLAHPWSMVFLSEAEALLAEKDGTLLRVNLADSTRTPIMGLPTDVARAVTIDTSAHPKGTFPGPLHGQTMAFNAGWFQVLLHPNYPAEPFVYLSYAAENEERASTTKLIRGRLEGNQLTQVETLFVAEPYTHGLFHYGGGMAFGPDGKLYLATGERNLFEYNNPPLPVAQDPTDPRGKIIRLNPDGSIPTDNPDFGPGAVPGLYALGIRAAQGLTQHPETGEIWFSEHGTLQGDELNCMQEGANYGWPYRTTGSYRTADYAPVVPEGINFTNPVYSWAQTVAPTGITFYTGRAFPQWRGNLIVPGLSRGSLWRVVLEGKEVVATEELFIHQRHRLRKAVVSPRGILYLLTDEDNGKIIRVDNEANR